MAENILEKDLTDQSTDEYSDAQNIFDVLALEEEFAEINDQAIKRFRQTRVKKEEQREVFDKADEGEKMVLVATDILPGAEFIKLRQMAIKEDCVLPGIHNVRNVFHRLYFLTEDKKYLLNWQN